MTGTLSGPKPYQTRYYIVAEVLSEPSSELPSKLIRADAIEAAVVEKLVETLRLADTAQRRVVEALQKEQKQATASDEGLKALRLQREAANQKLDRAIDLFDGTNTTVAREKIRELTAIVEAFDEEIARKQQHETRIAGAPEELASRTVAGIKRLAVQFPSLPPVLMRRVVRAFVKSAVADLDTKDVKLVFRLPDWAFSRNRDAAYDLCEMVTTQW